MGDRYEVMGTYFRDNPNVCIMQPAPEFQQRFQDEVFYETVQSVRGWEYALTNYTGGDWYTPILYYNYDDHYDKKTDDYPQCNIFIEYRGDSENKTLGSTAFNFRLSYHQYTYILISLEHPEIKSVEICIGCDGVDVNQEIKLDMSPKPLPIESIRAIIDHEFGHALGLGHYILNDDEKIHYDSIMKPSFKPFGGSMMEIRHIDLEALRTIYNDDGYGGLEGVTFYDFNPDTLANRIIERLS